MSIDWVKYYTEADNKKEVLNEIAREIAVLNYFAKQEILAYCWRRIGEWEAEKILKEKKSTKKPVEIQAKDFDKMTEEEFMTYWGAKK